MHSLIRRLRSAFGPADATKILRRERERVLRLITSLPPESREEVQGGLACAVVREPYRVETPHGPLFFAVLGETSGSRARGLLKKQKGTIAWIDTFLPGSVFWDIGANMGSYGLYAALRSHTRVVAFEPAAINHFLLAANCELNAFGERMDCLQLGLGRSREVGHLDVSQFDPAMSFSFQAKDRHPQSSRQACLILSVDELVEDYGLPCPNYVKIDVPALTEPIIEGARRTLLRPELRELHIEVREESKGGRRVLQLLAHAGFTIAGRDTHGRATDVTFARSAAETDPSRDPRTSSMAQGG